MGLGYWGPKLLRNFAANPSFRPVAVAERREAYRNNALILDRDLRVYEEAADLIDDPEIEAVVIATPVSSHFELARRALARFKHVLVEKPMCASVGEAEEIVALAKRTVRISTRCAPTHFHLSWMSPVKVRCIAVGGTNQMAVWSLAAEVHGGGSACWYAHRGAIRSKKSNQITEERGTTLSRKRRPAPSKINHLCHVDPRQL